MNNLEKFIAIVVALACVWWNVLEQVLIITVGEARFIEPNLKIAWLELLILVVGGYLFMKMINEPEKKEEEKDENNSTDLRQE